MATVYLTNGISSTPNDDIDTGDDIIEFESPGSDGYAFDAKFALVKVGDIIRVNYGASDSAFTTWTPFVIKEKKYIASAKRFAVRIAGKNQAYKPSTQVRIDRPLVNKDKYGVLAIAAANNNFNELPSLIVESP